MIIMCLPNCLQKARRKLLKHFMSSSKMSSLLINGLENHWNVSRGSWYIAFRGVEIVTSMTKKPNELIHEPLKREYNNQKTTSPSACSVILMCIYCKEHRATNKCNTTHSLALMNSLFINLPYHPVNISYQVSLVF